MTGSRDLPRPPPSEPPSGSVLLLRAIGDLQLAPLRDDPTAVRTGVKPITDMAALARASGLAPTALPGLIASGMAAGYIDTSNTGGIRLSVRGWRWHRWDQEHHRG